MKGVFYFLGGCVVVGFIIALVFSNISVFPYIGKSFLVSIEQGNYPQAYQVLSTEFKKKVNLPTFARLSKNNGLEEYQSVEWYKDVYDDKEKTGYVIGTITTKKGQRLIIRLDFIQEKNIGPQDKGWRINEINVKNLNPNTP